MSATVPEMIDAVFDISGDCIPANYPFALWHALARLVPELAAETSIGVLPLRTAGSAAGMLLPRRAKLVLRLPAALGGKVEALSGCELDVGGSPLRLGEGRLREIQPYPTIHAHLVVGTEDEVAFMAGVAADLAALGITASLICGRRNSLVDGDRGIHGFSLVIHDLKPEDSLRLLYAALGSERRYGCGVFVPYKVISDLY
jgi:CRISPR-associated protein Cas6